MMYFLFLLFPGAHCHGNMVLPSSWLDPGGRIGMRPQLQCQAVFSGCMWFTNYTNIPGTPSLAPALWTYPKQSPWQDEELQKSRPYCEFSELQLQYLQFYSSLVEEKKMKSVAIPPLSAAIPPLSNAIPPLRDFFSQHPWRAPGTAPLHSPCGVAGGNPQGCPKEAPPGEGGNCPGGGYGYGPRAEEFPFRDMVTTKWKLGSAVEVGWGITANHGGGYSYRLCKMPEGGRGRLTEQCFQATPLDFVGSYQWVQYGQDKTNRTRIPALRTRAGTHPPGSQWTRNPIPACAGAWGGFLDTDSDCRRGTQFPAPAPDLKGFGVQLNNPHNKQFTFSIVDLVQVPSDLLPGSYVLSFRWDCEQTPQVWSACANIQIDPQP